jgi:hypothetical protein
VLQLVDKSWKAHQKLTGTEADRGIDNAWRGVQHQLGVTGLLYR